MLWLLARQRQTVKHLLPLVSSYAMMQQTRGAMRLFELFSKEKREQRRKALKEEMDRGYFDDFRDFRDKKGKIFMALERLIPASQARPFPLLTTLRPDGSQAKFPPDASSNASSDGSSDNNSGGSSSSNSATAALLVCVAFRAGAQEMLESWAVPFSKRFHGRPGVTVCELSLVESVVMSVWPFKGAILRGGSKGADKYQVPVSYLFHFGNTDELRSVLFMTNRLTGYVYLLDAEGRVRWRGSGNPERSELRDLLRCTEALLSQKPSSSSSSSSNAQAATAGGSSSGQDESATQ